MIAANADVRSALHDVRLAPTSLLVFGSSPYRYEVSSIQVPIDMKYLAHPWAEPKHVRRFALWVSQGIQYLPWSLYRWSFFAMRCVAKFFGVVVCIDCGACTLVISKLLLFGAVPHPQVPHVHGFGCFGLEVLANKSQGRYVVRLDWRWRLFGFHFFNRHSHGYGLAWVYEKGPYFCFCYGGHAISLWYCQHLTQPRCL